MILLYFFCLTEFILYAASREVSSLGDLVLKHWFKCDDADEDFCKSDKNHCIGFDCSPQLDAALAKCAEASNPADVTPVTFTAIVGVAGSGSFCDNYRDVLVYDNQSIVPPHMFALQGWSFPFTSTERVFDFSASKDASLFLEFDRPFPQCNGKPPASEYKAFLGLIPPPTLDGYGNKLGPGFTTSCFDQRPPFGVPCIYDLETLTLRCPIGGALNQIKILRPGERYQLVVEINDPCPPSGEDHIVYRLPKPVTFVVSVATRLHVILQTLREAVTPAEKGQICSFNAADLDAAFIAGWYPIQQQLALFHGSFLRNVPAEACALLGGQPMSASDFDAQYSCGGLADDTCGIENIAQGEWRDGAGSHSRQRQPLVRSQYGETAHDHMAPQKD